MQPCGLVVVDETGPRAVGRGREALPSLKPVANRPIIAHVVDALVAAGVEDIIVACSTSSLEPVRGCLGADAWRGCASLSYLDQTAALDLPGAIRLAAPVIGSAPCIVHAAHGLLTEPVRRWSRNLRWDMPDAVLLVHQRPAPHGHLNAATRTMLHVAELDPRRAGLGLAGLLLFGAGALEQAASADWWSESEVDLSVVADRLSEAGGRSHVRLTDGWQAYGGDSVELLELNRMVLDRLTTDNRRPENRGNQIEGRVVIDDMASVQASVIVGPAVIAAGAQIADSYIGPYTSIGAGARIEGAEIERSIVSAGAVITHVGTRLAGSVIGRDARVFRDFSLPRALRLSVGDGTEVALS